MARQYAAVDKNTRAYKLQQIAGARSSLVLVLLLTLINVGMILANSMEFFVFSAFVPYILVVFGRDMDAGMVGSNTMVALVVAAAILIMLLLCWLFSKKKPAWLIFAAVLFALDTAALLFFTFQMAAGPAGQILNIVLHAYVLFQLIQGSVAASKLKKETEETFDDQGAQSPEIGF